VKRKRQIAAALADAHLLIGIGNCEGCLRVRISMQDLPGCGSIAGSGVKFLQSLDRLTRPHDIIAGTRAETRQGPQIGRDQSSA
jgi:hypothetical protein